VLSAKPNFVRRLEQEGDRSLICSECERCHARRIVSAADGSLQEWEDGHRCRKLIERIVLRIRGAVKARPSP
jgi:hypothetical protein